MSKQAVVQKCMLTMMMQGSEVRILGGGHVLFLVRTTAVP